jgi:stage II sporulation protein D
MRLYLVLLLSIVSVASASSVSNSVSANDVTVELFSSQDVKSIELSPAGAGGWMRRCLRCARQAVTSSTQVNYVSGGVSIAPGKSVPELYLEGNFHLKAINSNQEAQTAGSWKIAGGEAGLKVLLTIPSEAYVVAALNGEASADEPLASLRAMAVAVRTFALVNEKRHLKEGFDLCDSTHCQALQFRSARAEVRRAIQETAGETLWFGQQRAHIYYTQNCGGLTEDVSAAWPKEHAPYLASHVDAYCLRRSPAEWHAQISLKQLESVFQSEGWHAPTDMQSVRVAKRSRSGRALLLEFSGPSAHSLVSASSFRFAIDRRLGWNQLRSDWYDVSLRGDSLKIDGNGYGHGIGLCQVGAFEMASEGHSYQDILGFYFPGTALRVSLRDSGWKTVASSGLTLMTVAPSNTLLDEASGEWRKAIAIFPPRAPVHPTIFEMPTTELFRQTTGEPGWMLAATRGANVYLQPASVVRGRENSQNLLLHELLHVLIEQEAGSHTPLWLREGLAETLADAGVSRNPLPSIPLDELENALSNPVDKSQSQRAHREAAILVNRLVARYGISAVRGWLANGVPQSVIAALPGPG